MKQFFCILCLMLCLLCTSCGPIVWNGSGHAPTVTDSTQPEEPSDTGTSTGQTNAQTDWHALNALPSEDLGGVTVVLTTYRAADFASSGENLFDRALAERNAAVEEKYHISLAVTERTTDQIYKELTAARKADEYYSDLIAIPMSSVGRFAREGLIAPLTVDPSAEYYTGADAFTDRDALWATAGAASGSAEYAYCVYFNARLAAEAGFDLYAEVESGDWTWARFSELLYGRVGSGFACASDPEFTNCVFTSCGLQYSTLTDGVRICDYAGERAEGAMEIASSILYGGSKTDTEYAAGAFASGQCLFYIGTLAEAKSLADMSDSYGLLPLPSYSAGEPTHSYVSADLPVLCIPTGACAGEYAQAVYQALNAASEPLIGRAYSDYLMNYCLRDEPSVKNARIIGEAVTFDYAYVFGPTYDEVANCTYWAVQTAVIDGRAHDVLYKTYLSYFDAFVQS